MRRAALLLVAVLAAACGPGSYRDFRGELTSATCAWAERCGYVSTGDRANCPVEDLLEIFHDTAFARGAAGAIDVAGSIDAGRMRYDSVNAQTCLDAVAGAPCEPSLARRVRSRGCNAVISAHTETDRPCWADFECTGGICAHAPACAGICAAYASFGLPCIDNDSAPAAMHCDPTVAYCAEAAPGAGFTCQQKKPEGSPCTGTVECRYDYTCRLGECTDPVELGEHEACGGIEPCEQDLYCVPSTLLCEKQHLPGEACDSDVACEDGLACIGFTPAKADGAPPVPGVCGPWLQIGAACSAQAPETVSGCPPDSSSCTDGVCVARPPVAGFGEDCRERTCAPGLGCDTRGLCEFTVAIFGDCSGDKGLLCAPGLVCQATGTDVYDKPGSCVPADATACFLPPPAE